MSQNQLINNVNSLREECGNVFNHQLNRFAELDNRVAKLEVKVFPKSTNKTKSKTTHKHSKQKNDFELEFVSDNNNQIVGIDIENAELDHQAIVENDTSKWKWVRSLIGSIKTKFTRSTNEEHDEIPDLNKIPFSFDEMP